MQEMQETWVPSLGWEDPLGKEMATYSSILAWRIPQSSLEGYSSWSLKELDTTEHTCVYVDLNRLTLRYT